MKLSEWGPAFATRLTVWAMGRTVITEQNAREFVETYTEEERALILTAMVVDMTRDLKPPVKGRAA